MIYSACIINSTTRTVVMRVQIDSDKPNEINLPSNTEIAQRHDGDIGWTLSSNNEWINPNQPERLSKAQGIRNRRNYKLKESDMYALPDFPITQEKRNEWLSYRQALRDITEQPNFPDNVLWPTKPE